MRNRESGSSVNGHGFSVPDRSRGLSLAVLLLLGTTIGCPDNGPDPVSSVVISPASVSFAALGQTFQFSAEAQTSSGNPIAGVAIGWSEVDPSVCSVGGNGLVTAVGNGVTTVMATADDVSGGATCSVQQVSSGLAFVREPVGGLAEEPLTMQPIVEVRDANGNRLNADNATQVLLAVDTDPCGGTLSGTTALTVSAGEAVFTDLIIDIECSGYRLTASSAGLTGATSGPFNVAANIATVSVVPPTLTLASLGATAQLTIEARSPSGRLISGLVPAWDAGPTTVCTVSGAGVVTAVANGFCSVTATVDGLSGSAGVTVQQRAARVTVSPQHAAIGVAESATLSVAAFDALDNPIAAPTVELTCLDAGVIGVSGTDVTGLAPGVTDCTATVDTAADTARIAVVEQSGFALLFTVSQDTYRSSVVSGSMLDLDLWMIRPSGGDGDLGSLQGTLQWDPSQLTYVGSTVIENGFTWIPNETNAANGTLAFAGFSATGTASTFVLASVTFTVGGASGGVTDLSPSVAAAGTSLGDAITGLIEPVTSVVVID